MQLSQLPTYIIYEIIKKMDIDDASNLASACKSLRQKITDCPNWKKIVYDYPELKRIAVKVYDINPNAHIDFYSLFCVQAEKEMFQATIVNNKKHLNKITKYNNILAIVLGHESYIFRALSSISIAAVHIMITRTTR